MAASHDGLLPVELSTFNISLVIKLTGGKISREPVGALIADFVLVLDHLANGVVVFFNGFFHGCDIVKWMCLTHPYPLSRGEDKKVINNPVFAVLRMTMEKSLFIASDSCH